MLLSFLFILLVGSLTGLELTNSLQWLARELRGQPAFILTVLGLQVHATLPSFFGNEFWGSDLGPGALYQLSLLPILFLHLV